MPDAVPQKVAFENPVVEYFQWCYGKKFVEQEICEESRRHLSPDEAQKLRDLKQRLVQNRDLRNLLDELRELSMCLAFEGFSSRYPKQTDLRQWATGRAACLPVPHEELVIETHKDAGPTLVAMNGKATVEELEAFVNEYRQEEDERDREISRLFKKYVRGLVFVEDTDDGEDEVLHSTPTAMETARSAFTVWIEGIAEAYDYLQGNDGACVYSALLDVCRAQGAVNAFTEAPKKKNLEDREDFELTIADAIQALGGPESWKRAKADDQIGKISECSKKFGKGIGLSSARTWRLRAKEKGLF